MKKFIQLGAIFFGLLMTQTGFSQNHSAQSQGDRCCAPAQAQVQAQGCCETSATACEQWTLMCKQKPCYYNDWKCVEEKVPCKKQCSRMVPKYYEVDRCRYVPQHYKETMCRYEKECYEVDDCRTCKKWVCEQKCKMVPEYYWDHSCAAPQVAKPACCN